MSKNTSSKARKPAPKVHFQSGAKGVTSQAGMVPVVRFWQHLGFDQLCEQHLDFERGANSRYSLADCLFMTVIGLVAGANSLVKVVAVWSDEVLRQVGGWLRLPDDSVVGRILRSAQDRHIAQLEQLNHKARHRVWNQALKTGALQAGQYVHSWIDVDSTVKTVYGTQHGAAKGYNPFKRGALSYHPQVAFCCETKEILQAWLRAGNAHTSNGIVEFMRQLVGQLPNRMRIVLRADSGYFVGELLEWLDAHRHGYLIKVKLKGLNALLASQCWRAVAHCPGWEQCEFRYRCGSWSRERRFVAVRRRKDPPSQPVQNSLFDEPDYEYFCYVTTERLTPWQAHKAYGQRATCETWLDEAKNQMALAHLKSDDFVASSLLFQAAVLAYNTVRWMALLSQNASLKRWEIQTVRAYLIRSAGKLLSGGRQLRIKTPDKPLFESVWLAWQALASPG